MNSQEVCRKQRAFFNTNKTKSVSFRIQQLQKFKKVLKEHETTLYDAIYKDFGKSSFETYLTELALVYDEINNFIRHCKKWSKRKRVPTGLANFPAKSFIVPEPLGTVLVIGAWNYPYQLSLLPAITALAAGNTVILKPSELPVHTSIAMAKMINDHFEPDYFCVLEGGVKETTALLENRFDKIFFTGSTKVGHIVYQAAAKQLTPVTLELGGKSPTFVFADADLKMTAKRVIWAKFLNAGQTCVAPDYVLVEKSIEAPFLEALKVEIESYPTTWTGQDEHYLQIINTANFDRLCTLIDRDKVVAGGYTERENRFISPTILKDISYEDAIMQEEIFGPILPVLSFTEVDDAIRKVKMGEKPLACYVYSKSRKIVTKVIQEISFGGGAINDSVMHLSNNNLPFGGVGLSGIGNYHGKAGFDSFTHYKSILEKPFWFESSIKYPPYTAKKLKLIKWLFE